MALPLGYRADAESTLQNSAPEWAKSMLAPLATSALIANGVAINGSSSLRDSRVEPASIRPLHQPAWPAPVHFAYESRYRYVAMMRGHPTLRRAQSNISCRIAERDKRQDAIGCGCPVTAQPPSPRRKSRRSLVGACPSKFWHRSTKIRAHSSAGSEAATPAARVDHVAGHRKIHVAVVRLCSRHSAHAPTV